MSKELEICDKDGKLVRVYSEKHSDENKSFEDKAKEFAKKNGYSIKGVKAEKEEAPLIGGAESPVKKGGKKK